MEKEQRYEVVLPPRDIFLDPDQASWNWDQKGKMDQAYLEFPAEGGMLWHTAPGNLPYKGFLFTFAMYGASFLKCAIYQKLKDPMSFVRYRRSIRELKEVAERTVKRYFLKPVLYSRPIRELYRILVMALGSEFWAHSLASLAEWDPAYRWRMQFYSRFINPENLKKNPKKELLYALHVALTTDTGASRNLAAKSVKVRKLFKLASFLLKAAWLIPKIRKVIRKVAVEVNLKEFEMDENDVVFAFYKKQQPKK